MCLCFRCVGKTPLAAAWWPSRRRIQASERDDLLNIGGFSDAVFHVVAAYLSDDANRFVAEVESVELEDSGSSLDAPNLRKSGRGRFLLP